jgi:hypothetical protein
VTRNWRPFTFVVPPVRKARTSDVTVSESEAQGATSDGSCARDVRVSKTSERSRTPLRVLPFNQPAKCASSRSTLAEAAVLPDKPQCNSPHGISQFSTDNLQHDDSRQRDEHSLSGHCGPLELRPDLTLDDSGRPWRCPERNYSCSNYETCLGVAAALDWESFTCCGCEGSVDSVLVWKAHRAVRHDRRWASLLTLPERSDFVVLDPEETSPEKQARAKG